MKQLFDWALNQVQGIKVSAFIEFFLLNILSKVGENGDPRASEVGKKRDPRAS